MSKPIAIIPARGGSKRFPRKNIALLDGKPLVSYGVQAALQSELFGRVIVSSEDPEIQEIAQMYGAESFRRSEEFATDTAHELDACAEILDDLERCEGVAPEMFCVIYPTAVFVTAQDLQGAYKKISSIEDAEALMCVSGFNYHPYKALKENAQGHLEMLFPKECHERSQTYPHLTASNGTFYWLRTAPFRAHRGREYYQEKLIAYEIEPERAIDIDTEDDFQQVQALYQTLYGGKES